MRQKYRYIFFFLLVLIGYVLFCLSCSSPNQQSQITINDSVIEKPTFAEHIAPIIFKNCTPCHRPGESGPFNLLTYNDAVKAANKIKFVTQSRFMPPWPADPSYSHFIGERRLTDNEITLIKNWVDNGKPIGDSSKMPSLPLFTEGSFFGKPDLVVKLQEAIPLKGNGVDNFMMIKFPYEIPSDTFVKFIEFVPNQRKLVHHVNGHTISIDRSLDYFKGSSYLPDVQTNFNETFAKMNLRYSDGTFPLLTPNTIYYLPGYTPPVYPENIGGYKLSKKGAFLMKNIHYGPSSKDVFDSSYINVFYRRTKPVRPFTETQMGTFGVSKIEPELIIPPNEIKTFHTQWQVPQDISVLSVNPHMHLIGKKFTAYALQPNGDTIKLVKINSWDFRWQYYYTFLHPVKIPAGSIIHVYGVFDNTDKNPFNPFHPPQEISQGQGNESMQTTEEMFQFIFTYMPYQVGDEKIDLKGSY